MLFSIIIPTYNRAQLVIKTITWAQNQSFKDYEIIIVDDGSTDHTKEAVKPYLNEYTSYYKKENGERAKARNYGAHLAKGKYIYFLDSDDLIYPNHLQSASDFIQKTQAKLFFQQYEFTHESGQKSTPYLPTNINKDLIKHGNFMSCHGIFIHKDIFADQSFNEDRALSGSEDYELWLRLAARYPFAYNSEVTSTLVFHDERSVLNFPKDQLIIRKEKMLHYLFQDQKVMEVYGQFKGRIKSDAYSYIALHLMLSGHKMSGLQYFIKAFMAAPSILKERRTLAIFKHLFKNNA